MVGIYGLFYLLLDPVTELVTVFSGVVSVINWCRPRG
jgi:hypothetical protein